MSNYSTKDIDNKYGNAKTNQFNLSQGQVLAYTLGQKIVIDNIVPVPKMGKILLSTIDIPYIKESDKEDIINLLNYELNTSGMMYMLSIIYQNKEDLDRVLSGIISTFFNYLYINYKKQPITYILVYKNLNYFKQLKKRLAC